MNKWQECPHCHFSRDAVRILNCCSTIACEECISSAKQRCPRCFSFLGMDSMKDLPCYAQSLEESIASVLIKCQWERCKHLSTKIMIAEHERTCRHAPPIEKRSELFAVFADPSSTREARSANIFKHFSMFGNIQLLMSDSVSHTPNGDFIEHIILDTDTLPGLSLKYGASAEEIKLANKLPSGNIYERKTLRIPLRKMPVYSNSERDELEENLRKKLILQFKREHNIEDRAEAEYYLEEANYDYSSASNLHRSDAHWDASNIMPSQRRTDRHHS
eukprot:TRINITY_DN1134_c0_g1_i1.p1 TRINITY_DN1134_c0_g1~~TRINITY_DN1134_c0_g1_i1.p1  ORF type:complete len:275 (+),score=97.11 TRINITY_DN1134_c0_g1_i1:312-1136(+)